MLPQAAVKRAGEAYLGLRDGGKAIEKDERACVSFGEERTEKDDGNVQRGATSDVALCGHIYLLIVHDARAHVPHLLAHVLARRSGRGAVL